MIGDRPIYRTVDLRAEDLKKGDVTRNRFGKWDVVTSVKPYGKGAKSLYVDVNFETGTDMQIRTVALVKLQVVKPS